MNTDLLAYLAGLLLTFLVWTLVMYWLHRWSHAHHRRNPLWWIHSAHHRIPYLSRPPVSRLPTWPQFLFWLGNWRASLDVLVVMTVPLLIIALIVPQYGVPLLVFHYVYEVFFSEYLLDHNPRVSGRVTRAFAWGDFHLHHHAHPRRNFGLLITLWDQVFGTAEHPPTGSAMRKVEQMLARQQRVQDARDAAAMAVEMPQPVREA